MKRNKKLQLRVQHIAKLQTSSLVRAAGGIRGFGNAYADSAQCQGGTGGTGEQSMGCDGDW